MRWRYRAATAEGVEVDGTLDAASREAAIDALRRRALVPIAVDGNEAAAAGGADVAAPRAPTLARLARAVGAALGGGARATATALAVRTVGTLLDAGLPLDRALAFAAEQAEEPTVAAALADVRRAVRGGRRLGEAVARHPAVFPPLAVAMLSGGEAAGALGGAAERLADHLEQGAELRAQVRSALLYPALMAVVAAVGVTVILLVVVPRFVGMLGEIGGALPLSTRLLVAASRVIVGGWWLWLPLVVGGVAFARRWLAVAENRARWHAARLALPVVGDLERRWATAQVARTLALLLEGGTRLLPALRIAATAAPNVAVSAGVARAAARVGEGERLAAALAGVVPPLAARLLAVGEEGGRLGPMARRVADVYDGEVRRALRTAVALVEPVLIVVFGAIVGFVALALLQAVYAVDPSTL